MNARISSVRDPKGREESPLTLVNMPINGPIRMVVPLLLMTMQEPLCGIFMALASESGIYMCFPDAFNILNGAVVRLVPSFSVTCFVLASLIAFASSLVTYIHLA
jgi:hypothetical protein